MICSSGIGFDPSVAGTPLDFGFHGIWQGTAVIYDKSTGSRWLHLTGECIEGQYRGHSLEPIPGRHTLWREWRRDHPDTEVMAPVPRYQRSYFNDRNARRGHDFFPRDFPATIRSRDERLSPSALLYGVKTGGATKCYPFETLMTRPGRSILNDVVGESPVVLVFDARTGSAFAHGRRLEERVLELELEPDGRLLDPGSGSHFDADGIAVDGPLQGRRLPQLFALQAEWYGWYAAFPETEIYAP